MITNSTKSAIYCSNCTLFRSQKVFDLPDTVEIEVKDGDVWTEEDVTNYLCDKYGYFINGYALDTDVA